MAHPVAAERLNCWAGLFAIRIAKAGYCGYGLSERAWNKDRVGITWQLQRHGV